MRIDVYTWQDAYVATIGPDELLSLTHTDELNGEDSVDITTTFPLKQGYRLVWADRLGRLHEHICQDPQGLHADGETLYADTALNSICELYGDYIEDKRPYAYGYLQALNVALEPTRWEAGTVDQSGKVASGLTFYHTSAREALQAILECGGELETEVAVSGGFVSSRKVGIRSHRGATAGHRRFTYTKDLVSVARTEHYGAITACYGYGKGIETDSGGYGRKLTFGDINGGVNYVEDAEALKKYGRPDGKGGFSHIFGQFEDSSCEDAATLLNEAREYLDSHSEPGVSYEADVLDLVQFGRSWEGVGVGDDVQIVDTEYSPELRCSGRVTKLVTDLLGGTMTVTLGNVTETIADVWNEQQRAVSGLSRRSSSWDVAANTPAAYLQQVIAGLNEQFNTQGMSYCFTSFEQGTIWSSVPLDDNGHPTKTGGSAIQICSQGFRIASGTKADGSYDWRTFGTGKGFTADEITAGTLNADLIKAGTIQDMTGENYWNLLTGDLRMTGYAGEADAIVAAVPQYTWTEDGKTPASGASWYSSADGLWEKGKAGVLQRIMYTHADKSVTYSNPVLYMPEKGAYGTITSALTQYYLSTSETGQVGGSWTTKLPTWKSGCYYWSRTCYTWSDSSVTYSDPALMSGLNDTNQAASNLSNDLTELNDSVTSLAEDGVVTEAEKAAVEKVRQAMEKEQAEVKREYSSLYGNSSLTSDYKTTLASKYTAAFGSDDAGGTYGDLEDKIDGVVSCETSEALTAAMYEYKAAYSKHATAVKSYLAAAEAARHAIEQQDAADYADGILDDYDDRMNQQEIFNRLTDNGATQGIYMSGGKVYINATYMATGIIADKAGRNSWNLTTGALTTNYMTAKNITATGSFLGGNLSSGYGMQLTTGAMLSGYYNGTRYGYVDCSATVTDTSTGNLMRGLQLQANGIVRISAPRVGTAASSSTSTTSTTGFTGSISQPIVSELHDNGGGSVGWHYGTFQLRFINGLLTGYTTVST